MKPFKKAGGADAENKPRTETSEYEDALNSAFDALLKAAAAQADENIGRKIAVPEEKIEYSQEHQRKMHKIFMRERRKNFAHSFIKYAGRCACIVLILAAVSSAAVFSVSAWRAKVLNFVFDSSEPGTEFRFNKTNNNSYSNGNICLNYIPHGFDLDTDSSFENSVSVYFSNDDLYFSFGTSSLNGSTTLDTEDGTIEDITVNGKKGIYVSTPRVNHIMWYDDIMVYYISGNISKEEMFLIAQNVELL